jgi:hypothetical protein
MTFEKEIKIKIELIKRSHFRCLSPIVLLIAIKK